MEILQFGSSSEHTHQINQITGFRTEIISELNLNSPLNSGFYNSDNAVGRPTGIANAAHYLIIRRPTNNNNYQFQLAIDIFDSDDIYYRVFGGANNPATPEKWIKLVGQQSGVWTPVVNSDNNVIFTGTRVGTYLKLGSLVFINCNISVQLQAGQPNPTGNLTIGGFPFTFASRSAAEPSWCEGNGDGTQGHRVRVSQNSSLFSFFRFFGTNLNQTSWIWLNAGTQLSCDFSLTGIVN